MIAVGQEVIDRVPLPLKDWAIETFGTSDKVVLVVGTLVILVVVGIVVGIVAVSGRRTEAVTATAVVGLIGVVAVLTRPDPTFAKLLPSVVGTVVSIDGAVVAAPAPIPSVGRRGAGHAGRPSATPTSCRRSSRSVTLGPGVANRRAFLMRSVSVASLAVIAGGAGRLLQRRFDVGGERAALALPSVADRRPAARAAAEADFGVDGLTPFVTPNGDFYRIDTALVVPQVSKDAWSLRIHGMVDRELELTFDDLLGRDQIERYVTLVVRFEPGRRHLGRQRPVAGRAPRRRAAPRPASQPGATQLVSRSIDGWTCGTPVASSWTAATRCSPSR